MIDVMARVMKTVQARVFVMLDSSLLPIDRIAADSPYR
ncbi:hypothetical protein ACVWXU_000027 [Streptomyces sp. TE33382]